MVGERVKVKRRCTGECGKKVKHEVTNITHYCRDCGGKMIDKTSVETIDDEDVDSYNTTKLYPDDGSGKE